MIKLIGSILTLLTLSVAAQVHPGARFVSVAHAAVALQDVWSLQQNQAGLCGLKRPALSLGYVPSLLNNDLKTQSVVVAFPWLRHVFGISFQRYGIDEYNEQKIGFTYGRRFEDLSVALNSNYHQLSIQQYGLAKALSIEVGLQYWVTRAICLGVHVANPNRSAYKSDVVYIPISVQLGASYQFSDQLMLATSIEKASHNLLSIRTGVEYGLINFFYLRGGISINPLKQYIGLGFYYDQFKLELATSSHPVLGYTPQLALSYEL